MRFMVIVKANKDSEAGVMPRQKLLAEMVKYNEELVKAGVLLAAEGLPKLEEQTRPVLRREADRYRWALRDQGADRRLLAVAGEVDGRRDRVGQALPQSP